MHVSKICRFGVELYIFSYIPDVCCNIAAKGIIQPGLQTYDETSRR